jgi:hypothetical protein
MKLEQESHEAAEQPFNLGSPKQLQQILFEKLGLPVIRKTPKGQPSTAEDVLQELAVDYELPSLILEYRSLSKLKSTYTDKLPEQINPKTGRVHTSYHQAVAATGRLSSSDPNLQNIPIRTPLGRRIREAFIAPEGYLVMACDYSQIELRRLSRQARRTPGDRQRSFRGASRKSGRRSAQGGQGDQFRADVRNVRIRTFPSAQDRARRGAGVHGHLFHALSGCEAIHGGHP